MILSPLAYAGILSATMATAMVGVVTGGNSLVLVPAMIALGVPSRTAVATNMFAVTFLSLSGWLRFARAQRIRWDVTRPLLPITLVTSWVGARLVGWMSDASLRLVVAVSLVAMLGLILANPGFGSGGAKAVGRARFVAGLAVSAVLGVYGGLYSGGYTTLLTFTSVGMLGTTLPEALGLTKVVNFVSSAIASVEFAREGLVDWPLAVPMALVMLVGGWLGASLALRVGQRALRAVFLTALLVLTAKLLVVDPLMPLLRR